MQEKEVTRSAGSAQTVEGLVVVSLRSHAWNLTGTWIWDLQADAIYCSDVMDFPAGFEGTKGLIHPEDVQKLAGALHHLQLTGTGSVDFRLITTYGEIKTITGGNVRLDNAAPTSESQPAEPWSSSLAQLALRHEADFLQQRTALADTAERLCSTGSFVINKSTGEAWYSDGVYRIHGLPPQSLNHHANTFLSFLHPDDHLPFLDAFEAAYAGELPLHVEYRLQLPDGGVKTVRLVTQWSYNNKGQALFNGILQDLSEEAAAALEVAESKSKWLLHQQALKIGEQSWNTGYCFVDVLTRKTSFSDNLFRLYGLKQQTASSLNTFLQQVHPDDRERIKDLLEKMYSSQELPEAEFRILRPDGRQRQLKQSGKRLTVADHTVMVITVQDLTVQRGLEKKLAELAGKTRFQEAVQQLTEGEMQSGIISWHQESRMSWSEGVFHLLGYKPGAVEPSSKLLHQQLHPDGRKAFKEAETLLASGGVPEGLQFRVVNRGGERLLSISFHRLASGQQEVTAGVIKDITQPEALLQKMTASVHFAETVQGVVSELLFLTDINNTVLSWNSAAEEKTGIKTTEAVFSNLFDLFPQLKEEGYRTHLQAAQSGTQVREAKARNLYLRKAHHYTLLPLRSEKGAVTRVLHVVQDVSKEFSLQQQLTERLRFIESLVDASVDRIVALDEHMNYIYWNRKAEEYYAMPRERVIGRNILEVFPGFRNDPSYSAFRRVLRGESVYLPPVANEENGDYFETYLIPVTDEQADITAILWVVHDLSHEAALQQVQRMARQQLEEEHRRLKEAQAIGRVGSFSWEVGAPVAYWSDELFRINGLEPQSEAITLDEVDRFIHPADFAELQKLKEASLNQAGNYGLLHRIVRRSGEVRWVAHQWESIAGETGRVVRVSGIVQDITEQKRAEERIKEQSHFLRRILETGPDMVSIIDLPSMKTHYLNDETFAAHGFGSEYMTGRRPEELRETIFAEDRPLLVAYFQKFALAGDEDVMTAEYRAKNSRGEWRWFFVRGKVFQRNEEGKVTQVLNVIEDITARKEAEERVRVNQELLAATMDSSTDMIQVFEAVRDEQGEIADFRYILLNHKAEKWMPGATGKSLLALQPDVVDQGIFGAFKQVVETGVPQQFEKHYVHELFDGWFHQSVVKLGDGVATTTSDITKQKKAEQEVEERTKDLQANKELLQSVFNASLHGIILFKAIRNTDGEITDYEIVLNNAVTEKWNGRSLVGKLYGEEFPHVREYGIAEAYNKVLETGEPMQMEVLYEGEGFNNWFTITAVKASTDELVATAEDITERKAAEQEVRKNLTILQQTEDMAHTGSWEYDIATGQFTWSEGMYRLLGLPQNERVTPETYLDFAAEEDRSVAKRIIKNLKKGRSFDETMRIKRGGEERLLIINGSAVQNEGSVQKVVGVDVDITNIVQAEQKAAESQHWLEQTTQASPDAITIYDLHAKQPVYLNHCLAQWLGLTTDALLNMGIEGRLQLVHPDDRLRLLHFKEKLKAAKDGDVLTLDYRIRRRDDAWIWIRNRGKVFRRDKNGNVTHVLSILQDVTEEKAAAQVLVELSASLEKKNAELEQKNDDITSFAFVASHDLKEPLRKIHTFSD